MEDKLNTILIPLALFRELMYDSVFLEELIARGVEHWEGYAETLEATDLVEYNPYTLNEELLRQAYEVTP